jgi:DNA-binding response OmpR family regulator
MERHKTEEIYLPDETPITFLIVEDNKTIYKFVQSILNKTFSPCNIDIVEDPHEAINVIRNSKYDLILLDSTLKVHNAEDWIGTIRSMRILYPIIIMALSETLISQDNVIAIGAEGIVYKPIDPKFLVKEICSILNVDMQERGYASNFNKTIKIEK